MASSLYERVTQHHLIYGDDYGSDHGRYLRYDVALSMFPPRYDSLLDVGCGEGLFRAWWKQGQASYTGIDLLDGQNVLDYHDQHDVVLALGVLYKIPHGEQLRLVKHMWNLCEKALIVNTLALPRDAVDEEWPADPSYLYEFCRTLTNKIVLRTDYLDGDLTIGLYRR